MLEAVEQALKELRHQNPGHHSGPKPARSGRLRKILVANRGEIAKRFFLACKEEGLASVAIVTDVDVGQSWYEFADEVILLGNARGYTDIPRVIAAVLLSEADGVYPGYGFLSEDVRFVESLAEIARLKQLPITFLGPPATVMRRVGDKLAARDLAQAGQVPMFPATDAVANITDARAAARQVGYPVIVKLSAGGGGKGMTPVFREEDLEPAIDSARRLGREIYNDDNLYLEKFIEEPVHIEAQIFNGHAVALRKCAVQRRNQKIIEESGHTLVSESQRAEFLRAAENMARISGYAEGGGAGTVEFLLDRKTGLIGFLEINARIQVEYPVTDQELGIDLVKWQLLFFDGRGDQIPLPINAEKRAFRRHAIQCRVYAEDPDNQYAPAPGRITEMHLPTFNGVRCDFGFVEGDSILPHYDPMIGKLISTGDTRHEALVRMERALSEIYIKGITTNLDQLLRVVRHPAFIQGDYTNRILDDHPDLVAARFPLKELARAAALAALGEYAFLIGQAVDECFHDHELPRVLNDERFLSIPTRFRVSVYDRVFECSLFQIKPEVFFVFLNADFAGEITLVSRDERSDNLFLKWDGRTVPVRRDRRPGLTILRLPAADGPRYFRCRIVPLGGREEVEPPGLVRSPFQGHFVKFANGPDGRPLQPGDRLRQGLMTVDEEGGRRTVAEGEILARIDEEKTEATPAASVARPAPLPRLTSATDARLLDALVGGDLEELVRASPATGIHVLLRLLRAGFQGMILDPGVMDLARKTLDALPEETFRGLDPALLEKDVEQILNIYATTRQLFSPALRGDVSYFSELSELFAHWGDENFRTPFQLLTTLTVLFRYYGIREWSLSARSPAVDRAFFFLQRGTHAGSRFSHCLVTLVRILRYIDQPGLNTYNALNKIVVQQQAEPDDSLGRMIREIISRKDSTQRGRDQTFGTTRKYFQQYRALVQNPFEALGMDEDEFRAQALVGLPHSALVPEEAPAWVREDLQRKLGIISQRARVERLFSPVDSIFMYLCHPAAGTVAPRNAPGVIPSAPDSAWQICYVYLPEGTLVPEFDEAGRVAGAENMERACLRAVNVIAAYRRTYPERSNWLEILANGKTMAIDLYGEDDGRVNYDSILKISYNVFRFFVPVDIQKVLLCLRAERRHHARVEEILFSAYVRHGRLNYDFVFEDDRGSPYWTGLENDRNQRLYDRNKWPVEIWARECFDGGVFEEILIPSLDGPPGAAPVGARIFHGMMEGVPALYFMKDSRFAGGATGDREGLKYIAAAIIAASRDWPLYVWNDGAGANIKQGMVALNRAAEGFFLNALLNDRKHPAEFLRYLHAHPDPRVGALLAELAGLGYGEFPPANRLFLTAVGIGSSTGLDVYGSSQAALQIMVDSDESYRVLTGSGVIRSVTGEDLTNYEIGGARVMGTWTGTVDLVADNKIHLLVLLRRLQRLFASGTRTGGIQRHPLARPAPRGGPEVLNEAILESNVDAGSFLAVKDRYHEAGSLVGGFARLGGRRALIMGPRTRYGIRSAASVTRARELLRIAYKTGTPQILVFGPVWYYHLGRADDPLAHNRLDFVRTLNNRRGLRLHIVLHPEGLRRVTLNAPADAIIYVTPEHVDPTDQDLIRQVATFSVATMEAAFDLAARLLDLTGALTGDPSAAGDERTTPIRLPADAAIPFDMRTDVIEPLVDSGTFVEFFRDAPPGLLTGLARIQGRTVGIIGDQPAHQGGAPDAPGTQKYRVFMEFLNRHRIPLLMLSNAPGFLPGTRQERLRIQQIGAESLDVNVLGAVPVVSVTLNHNYGGRQIHAFSKYLRPAVATLALRRSLLAVMGASAAFDLFHGVKYRSLLEAGAKEEAARLRDDYVREFNTRARAENDAAATGIIDELIDDVDTLRPAITRALDRALLRGRDVFD